MSVFSFPELYCPFPSKVNKYADILEDYAIEWLLRFNLVRNESIYQRFYKAKFYLIAAGAYPNHSFEDLKIGNDWLTWLFVCDDYCESKEPESLKFFYKRFVEIFKGAEITSDDISLSHALSDIRQRMIAKSSLKYFHIIVRCFEDYFYGCLLEAKNREQRTIPDIETYSKIRRLSVAGDLVLAWVEFFDELIIPDDIRKHQTLKEINKHAATILAWCNDIFSCKKEKASGDFHNLVLVLHYQQELCLESAIQRAVEMHNQEIIEMLNLEVSLPSFGEDIDIQVAKYLSGIHIWIRSNLDWSYKTARYHIPEKMDLVDIQVAA
jgi:5-epi-alpha-selinene synthase